MHNRAQQSLSHSGVPPLRRGVFLGKGLGLSVVKTRRKIPAETRRDILLTRPS